jgi:hypothetical protein
MWLPGVDTIEKLFDAMAKLAAAEPWHCAQLLVLDGAFAWIKLIGGMTEKSELVWHDVHCELADTGM